MVHSREAVDHFRVAFECAVGENVPDVDATIMKMLSDAWCGGRDKGDHRTRVYVQVLEMIAMDVGYVLKVPGYEEEVDE